MKEEETILQVLGEINQNLDRIASALESYNNAAIRGFRANESDGQIEIVTKGVNTVLRRRGRMSRRR